ncbi:MAG: GTP-binding protein [Paracoccaceae bacterium]|nr:GTP-binding protein [Paracoccaceae bacterium]
MIGPKALPVTIISGYLGAGKTTLVNNALRKANGLKLAILVNEFGNLAIDEDLIIAQDDNMISLAGGCICCSYGNDMLLSLKELTSLDNKPDHIILEASGVAIPSAIESSISLITECFTESIVSIIDCEQIQDQLNDKYIADTVISQIQSADIILANKADLIKSDSPFHNWKENHEVLNKAILVSHSDVDLDIFLGITRQDWSPNKIRKKAGKGHTNKFWSKVFFPRALVDPKKLSEALTQSNLFLVRAKGHVSGPDAKMYEVQSVGHRSYIKLANKEKLPGLVLIGTKEHMDFDLLNQGLKEFGSFSA